MPTPTLTPDDQRQDEVQNIGQRNADQTFNRLSEAERRPGSTDMSGFEDSYAGDSAKDAPDSAEDYARKKEAEAASGAPGGWADRTSEDKKSGGKKFSIAGLKKRGALYTIIVFLLGIVGIGGTLFTPSIGLIHMKEILTSDLNDQLAAMDIRGEHVFRAKLKSISSGVCTGIQIKCKFSTMSKKQVAKFQSAFERYGYTIPEDGIEDTKLGRQRITKIVAPDGSVISNPADLVEARRTTPDVRRAMNRVYNPLYYGVSDKVANTFLEKNRTNKQKKLTGTTVEENREQLAEATSGERAGSGGSVVQNDGDRQYVVDESGNRVYSDQPGFEAAKAAAEERLAKLAEKPADGGKATGGVMRGAGLGISVLGFADASCGVYNLGRAVAATAKVARSTQLVQFAMVVNTTVDAAKAGDGTTEEMQFIGDMMTATDTRKTVFNPETQQEEPNPFYGKSAFDSPGYKTAAFNDAPTLTPQSQQYMVGGGLSGTLAGIMTNIENTIGGGNPAAVRDVCNVVQSPWVRGIGFVGGILLAVGSFGVGTAVSVTASAAVSFAIPFLEAALSDIVSGNVIGTTIAGVDAGDAFFAGSGALLGGIAMARGMAPLSKTGVKSYLATTADTRSDLVADAKAEATDNQWDVTSQYSFLGSLTRSLYPSVSKAKSSVSGAVMSVGSILNLSAQSLTKDASAVGEFNEERFSKCNDPAFLAVGIDGADIFCNVRYGLTEAELSMDTEAVVDFMVNGGYISNTGTPQGEYAKFMENCANREDGWGEFSEEGGSTGAECIDGSGSTMPNISYFRVYTMDYSISEAMDDETDAASQMTGTGEFVLPTNTGYGISSTWGPRSCSGCSSYHKAVDISNFPSGSSGQPVYSIGDGTVESVVLGNGTGMSCTSGMGNAPYGANNPVRIRHNNGLVSIYLHMPAGSVTVREGDTVTAGQQIGVIGNCGQSFGAHLHFETLVDDSTEAQFKDIGGSDAYGPWRNPLVVMPMLGVDIANGTYTDGR